MKVFVTGATGVLGRSAVKALLRDGHEGRWTGSRATRRRAALEALGAAPVHAHLFDEASMVEALAGYDAVCNLATHMPIGIAAMRSGGLEGQRPAAHRGIPAGGEAAGTPAVGRLIQESASFVYADGGDEWLTESSPLAVTRAVEPAAIAETNAAEFAPDHRDPVILRFGNLIGDDPMTRWRLAQARSGRPVGLGAPHDWAHSYTQTMPARPWQPR